MHTDPTDNGGLFVGRRPGTAPTKYRSLPERGTSGRRRADGLIAHALLGSMVVVSLLFWGPIPAAALWVAARIQYWTASVGLAVLVGFAAMLGALMLGLVLLKRLDHAWILVRRAAGMDQRQGVMPRVFAITAAVCAAAFLVWFLLINGPGSSTFSGRG